MTSNETVIYKITTRALFEQGVAEGVLPPSPIDETDGYMHFSTGDQVRETLQLHFAGQTELVLCAVPVDAVESDLRWEPSRGGALFPHLYAPLPLAAITAHYAIAVADDGSCALPAEIA